MKRKYLKSGYQLLFVSLFLSCGGGNKETTTEEAEETTSAEETPAVMEFTQETAVGVTAKVADFDTWLAIYQKEVPKEVQIGTYQSIEDPNMVLVTQWTMGHEEAMTQFDSEETKASIAKSGASDLQFVYYDLKSFNSTPTSDTLRVFVSHEVSDFDAWKIIFDTDEENRQAAGMSLRGLSTNAENPNMVHMAFSTNDLESMNQMMASDEMKAKMKEAGVTSEPQVSIWKIVKM